VLAYYLGPKNEKQEGTMERPSRSAILDALTGDSYDGCDGDWRASVLANASRDDLQFIARELGRGGELYEETASRLRLEGKI
jgi:hypothetical protein